MNKIDFFASSRITVRGMTVEVEFDRGFINPTVINDKPHNHAGYELTAVLAGRLDLNIGEKVVNVDSGEFIILPPRIYHRNILGGSDLKRLSFRFSLIKGEPYSNGADILRHIDVPTIRRSREIAEYTEAVQYEMLNGSLDSEEMVEAKLKCLFITLLRLLSYNDNLKGTVPSVLTPPSRTKIIDTFFSFRYAEQVTINDLAKELFLSSPQTNRILQRDYGQGFRNKLRKTRISESCKLLLSSDDKLSTIAYKVGYLSESGFFVAFRSEMGMTPQEYKLHRDE